MPAEHDQFIKDAAAGSDFVLNFATAMKKLLRAVDKNTNTNLDAEECKALIEALQALRT